MIDIVSVPPTGTDIGLYDTENERAANILGTQLGALEYAPLVGPDLRYFLTEGLAFQNESFVAYLIEVLANQGINVSMVAQTMRELYAQYEINITPSDNSTALVAK